MLQNTCGVRRDEMFRVKWCPIEGNLKILDGNKYLHWLMCFIVDWRVGLH
jgi:hypothetical protein